MAMLVYESETDRKNHLLFMRRDIKQTRMTRGAMLLHGSIELLFGLSGRSEVIIDGETIDITEGRVIFIKRFQRHNFNYLEGSKFYVVVISSNFFDGVNELNRLTFPTVMEKNESFEKIRALLDVCYSVRNTDSMAFKSGFVNLLISTMRENYPHTLDDVRADMSNVLVEILDYINGHFKEDISVTELSKHFGYSPNYFSTVFNKFVGMGFREYLNRRRMEEYTVLKKNFPEISSYKAAETCGFRNLSSFYDTVKKMKADSKIIDVEF